MNLKNKNKGFSLIELIVTIAIMAIVTGAAVSIYSFINTHRLEKLVGNTSDCLNDLRSYTMSKPNNYCLVIRKDGDDYLGEIYYYKGSKWELDSSKLIGSVGKLTVTISSGTDAISESRGLIMGYNKSGSLSYMKMVNLNGAVPDCIDYTGDPLSTFKIDYSYAGKGKKLTIASMTGKHYVEKN